MQPFAMQVLTQTLFAYTFPLLNSHRINDELMRPLVDLVVPTFGMPSRPDFPDRTAEDFLRAPLNFLPDYGLTAVASDTDPIMKFPLTQSGRSPALESSWMSPLEFVDIEEWQKRITAQDKAFMDELAALFGTTARWLMIRADASERTETALYAPWGIRANWPCGESAGPPQIRRWTHTLGGPTYYEETP